MLPIYQEPMIISIQKLSNSKIFNGKKKQIVDESYVLRQRLARSSGCFHKGLVYLENQYVHPFLRIKNNYVRKPRRQLIMHMRNSEEKSVFLPLYRNFERAM